MLPQPLSKYLIFSACCLLLSACSGGGGGGNGGGGGGGGTYTVYVSTTGLTGAGLVVGLSSDAGTDTMTISSNGTVGFSLKLPAGATWAVGVGTQPSGQSCSIGGNFWGTGISSNVTATVTCSNTYSVGGTVTGLTGDLVLRLDATGTLIGLSDTLTVPANSTSFTFTKKVEANQYYAVSVYTQPAGQLCRITNGGGKIGSSSVTNVAVSCTTAPTGGYKVGGSISGLYGVVVLSLNSGTEELATMTNGSFTFSTPLNQGASYAVTVLSVPSGYDCAVENGSGTMGGTDYPFVKIVCSQVGSAVKVNPNGDYLTLTLNGTEDMTLGSFDFNPKPFKTRLNTGDAYAVTVKTPPTGKVCVLHDSVGTIEAGVTPPLVTLSCVADTNPSYTIGGSITGLSTSGLVLNLDGRDTLNIAASDITYTFPTAQPDLTSHTVSIKTQPTGQICSVTNNNNYVSGSNITNADIICSAGPHSIGGFAAGVTGSGLTLALNGTDYLSLPAGGAFTFNTLLSDGMDFDVTIVSQPTGQVCNVARGSGNSITASVDSVIVDCANIDYAVSVNVAGYSSSSPLYLQLNGDEIMSISANTTGAYTYVSTPVAFNTRIQDTQSYTVTIAGQPAGQTCVLTNSSGSINGADVTNIGAYCVTEPTSAGPYTVGVSTAGLQGSGLVLQLNGGSDLAVNANGYNSFSTTLADTSNYTVTVLTQPASPLQFCDVVNGNGTISGANVTNISIQCGSAVKSLYPNNGNNWLDYVKNDSANIYSATDTACDPAVDTGGYNVCLNGGEFRVVLAPYLASCTGVSASDNLGAFDWICDATASPVRLISTGLKTGVGLSDLIDFGKVAFKPNFLVINDGVTTETTQSAIWWSNTVRKNNTDEYIYSGEINLITGSVNITPDMVNRSAVLVQPGFAVAGLVSATAKNFLWFEGGINSSAGNGLDFSTTRFSLVRDAQSNSNTGDGIVVSGNDNKLLNITANNNAGSYGISIYGNNLYLDNLTANNSGGTGIYISTGNSSISNLSASGNVNGGGVRLSTTGNNTVNNVTADNNGTVSNSIGISIVGNWSTLPGPHTISNLSATGNGYKGIYVEGLGNSSLSNFIANNNGFRGIDLWEGNNSPLVNFSASGNGDIGIMISRWDNTSADRIVAAANVGDGVNTLQTSDFKLTNVTSSNNGGHGVAIDSSNRLIAANITAANNTSSGIAYLGSSTNNYNNILLGATSVNNGGDGFELTRMSYLNLSSLLSANNGGNGFHTYTFLDHLTQSNLVSANNTGYGYLFGSDYGYYTGLLEFGTNAMGDCKLDTGIITQPGLAQGGSKGSPNNTCVISDASDGTVVANINASSSLVGKVTADDTVNPDDSAGAALYQNITSWSLFEHDWRTWGVDGSLAFADSSNQGACNTSGFTCRIWDWSAATADVGNGGSTPAVYNVLALPTGNDVLSMVWTSSATGQAYCDTNYPGSVYDGLTTSCTTTYLRHAREITGDAIGNDNLLCESGETCLYTPNIGSYQGHGSLVSAGSFVTGRLVNITLMKYQTLGR